MITISKVLTNTLKQVAIPLNIYCPLTKYLKKTVATKYLAC